jgi:methylated-DNA-[protein]-cysteine S-methyltransferase
MPGADVTAAILRAVRVTWTRYAIPGWGVGELGTCEGLLVEHVLPRPGRDEQAAEGDPLVAPIRAYFAGKPVDFGDVPLFPFERTPFEEDVLAAARTVPHGETVSYGDLAAAAGYPRAARAVGSFCARNPFGLVVPCHRVVAADGPGSYGSLGIAYKLRLLRLEGAAV